MRNKQILIGVSVIGLVTVIIGVGIFGAGYREKMKYPPEHMKAVETSLNEIRWEGPGAQTAGTLSKYLEKRSGLTLTSKVEAKLASIVENGNPTLTVEKTTKAISQALHKRLVRMSDSDIEAVAKSLARCPDEIDCGNERVNLPRYYNAYPVKSFIQQVKTERDKRLTAAEYQPGVADGVITTKLGETWSKSAVAAPNRFSPIKGPNAVNAILLAYSTFSDDHLNVSSAELKESKNYITVAGKPTDKEFEQGNLRLYGTKGTTFASPLPLVMDEEFFLDMLSVFSK